MFFSLTFCLLHKVRSIDLIIKNIFNWGLYLTLNKDHFQLRTLVERRKNESLLNKMSLYKDSLSWQLTGPTFRRSTPSVSQLLSFNVFSFSQNNCHFTIPMQHLLLFFPLLYLYLLNFIQLNYSINYN